MDQQLSAAVENETRRLQAARKSCETLYEDVRRQGAIYCSAWLMEHGRRFVTDHEPERAKEVGQEKIAALRARLEKASEEVQFKFMAALDTGGGARRFVGEHVGIYSRDDRHRLGTDISNSVKRAAGLALTLLGQCLAHGGFLGTATLDSWFWGRTPSGWDEDAKEFKNLDLLVLTPELRESIASYATSLGQLHDAQQELRRVVKLRDRSQATDLWGE